MMLKNQANHELKLAARNYSNPNLLELLKTPTNIGVFRTKNDDYMDSINNVINENQNEDSAAESSSSRSSLHFSQKSFKNHTNGIGVSLDDVNKNFHHKINNVNKTQKEDDLSDLINAEDNDDRTDNLSSVNMNSMSDKDLNEFNENSNSSQNVNDCDYSKKFEQKKSKSNKKSNFLINMIEKFLGST
jgi:hypothetical protein